MNIIDELIVVKRSGQRVPFNGSKIAIAIKKGFDSIYTETDEKKVNKIYEKVLEKIETEYQDRKTINVEDIQDLIENALKDNEKTVYTAFSEYRKKRELSRKAFGERQQHKFVKAIDNIIKEYNSESNINSSYDTLCRFGKNSLSEYTKAYILDNKFVKAHDEGSIYIHNADYFYLGIIPEIHLKLNFTKIAETEFDNLLNIIISSQKEVNNEIAIDAIDYLFAPWLINNYKKILKNNLINNLKVNGLLEYLNSKKLEETIDKEYSLDFDYFRYEQFILNPLIKEIFKLSYYTTLENLNELTKNTFYRLINTLQNNYEQKTIYTLSFGSNDTQIGNYLNDYFIETINNFAYSSKIHFIYKIKNDENDKMLEEVMNLILNHKNISLAFLNTSYNHNENEIEYFANGYRIFENCNSDHKTSNGKIVVSTTSINMARIALKNGKRPIKYFYELLDEIMELVKNQLSLVFETIGDKNKENYKILFQGTTYDDEKLEEKQKIRKVIKSGNLNISLVGLKECVDYLENDESKKYKLTLDILKHLNNLCEQYSEKTKLNFGICETSDILPRKELMAIDKAIYGIKPKITDKEYYDLIQNITNDYHNLGEIQKYFTHGSLLKIKINKNMNFQKFKTLVEELQKNDIGFMQIVLKESEVT